jgi:hypothetical protein
MSMYYPRAFPITLEVAMLRPDEDDPATLICDHCGGLVIPARQASGFAVFCPACSARDRFESGTLPSEGSLWPAFRKACLEHALTIKVLNTASGRYTIMRPVDGAEPPPDDMVGYDFTVQLTTPWWGLPEAAANALLAAGVVPCDGMVGTVIPAWDHIPYSVLGHHVLVGTPFGAAWGTPV